MIPFLDLRHLHHEIRADLERVWQRALDGSDFIGGPTVEAFEAAFAAYCGADHCVGVGNGTDALELILAGLGIGPGDEVILPANTFVATAEAVTTVGATPVFSDVEPGRLLIGAEHVRALLSPRTVAVVVVHLYGQPVDMDAVAEVASAAGIAVVEDAAQAHGAAWRGRRVGSIGHAAGFSFYPGKNLGALGDGGAVVTGDAGLAARVRSLANHGRSPSSAWRHEHDGRNSRLDALQAAFLSEKLPHLDRWNEQRRRMHAAYRRLVDHERVQLLEPHPAAEPVHHLEVVRVDARDEVRAVLTEAGIGTGIHYPVPCHLQEPFRRFGRGPLAVCEATAGHLLSLPMHPALEERDVEQVCQSLSVAAPPATARPTTLVA